MQQETPENKATTTSALPAEAATGGKPEITDEQIALRAYHRWQARGCPIGDDAQDWFDARAELEALASEPD
jgi:Protein of unknown function (DUF2934)